MSDVLKVGDNSPRVAEVRKSLARLGLLPNYNESGNPDHAIYNADTLFDDELEAALRGFQQARGIIASGSSNRQTRALAASVPQAQWQAIADSLAGALRQRQFEAGLTGALAAVTELMVQHAPQAQSPLCPSGAAAANQLPDTVVLC